MAVSPDQGAVQADVAGLYRRDGLQLGGSEVVLHNAVLLVEQLHDGQLYPAGLLLVSDGLAAQQQVQRFSGDGLRQGLLVLSGPQVGQKVRDDQPGLPLLLADADGDLGPVLPDDHAVEGQGDGHPLVLADAAVVVGFEIGQLAVLIEGVGLQVQPGGIDVGRRQLDALREGLLPDVGQHNRLAPVADIELVSGIHGHSRHIGPVARGLRQADGFRGAEAFRLAHVQKALVAGTVVLHGRPAVVGEDVVAVLLC